MPREVVTVQVGQCGNQIGCRFWDVALTEHAAASSLNTASNPNNKLNTNTDNNILWHGISHFSEPLSSFFHLTDGPGSSGNSEISMKQLKARAVLVDMESGVLNAALKDPKLGSIFDEKQLISDVSGAGNNWAHGYCVYGPQYHKQIRKSIRKAIEQCDSLQCFLVLQSIGGGTGSGVGTFILEALEHDYPEYFRLSCCVTPSREDDVITSPYNAILAMNKLINHADAVLPVNNDSLITVTTTTGHTSANSQQPEQRKTPYGDMNFCVAQVLNHLTSSMRFEGSLNLDLNEITTNLVPYPRLHFLSSSLSPLTITKDRKLLPRSFDQMFSDVALSSVNSLSWSPTPSQQQQLQQQTPSGPSTTSSQTGPGTTLAQGFLVRSSDCGVADVMRNIVKVKEKLRFLPYNEDAIKTGLCSFPPIGLTHSCLGLANSTAAVPGLFAPIQEKFRKIYRRKAHVHHYTEFMEQDVFDEAHENLSSLIEDYRKLEKTGEPPGIKLGDTNSNLDPISAIALGRDHNLTNAGRNTNGIDSYENLKTSSILSEHDERDWPAILFSNYADTILKPRAREWVPEPIV